MGEGETKTVDNVDNMMVSSILQKGIPAPNRSDDQQWTFHAGCLLTTNWYVFLRGTMPGNGSRVLTILLFRRGR